LVVYADEIKKILASEDDYLFVCAASTLVSLDRQLEQETIERVQQLAGEKEDTYVRMRAKGVLWGIYHQEKGDLPAKERIFTDHKEALARAKPQFAEDISNVTPE